MSSVSLLDVPPEILHRIFDYLNTPTIVRSLRCVCNRFYDIVNTYNRFDLDSTSLSKLQLECALHVILPVNIVSLIVSILGGNQSDKIDFLLTILDNEQFTRLRSLTLLNVDKIELDRLLPHIIRLPLTSFAIQLTDVYIDTSLPLLSAAIAQWNLRKLDLIGMRYITRVLSWPVQSTLSHLTISYCDYREYQSILGHSPFLRTFVMQNFDGVATASTLPAFYPQLTSLVMNNCYLSFEELNLLLSLTPSLVHLKLVASGWYPGSLFDGFLWEEFIQTKLPRLLNIDFCFRRHISKPSDQYVSLHSLINSYRTPFWLENKRWFVTCDYVMRSSSSSITIYTKPELCGDFQILIRCKAVSNNDVCYFTKTLSNENDCAVQEEETIIELNLENSNKGLQDIQYLACALQYNTTLVTLNLNHNEITAEGIEHLTDALQNNTTLRTLSICGNQVGDEGTRHLSYILRNNTVISFSGNLSHVQLSFFSMLTTLNMGGNRIGDEGTRHLADALHHNISLTTLDIQDNNIGDDGIQHLCNALRKNTTMLTLDLSSNQIEESKARHLADMLTANKTLTTLNLRDNELRSKGIEHLVCALHLNTTLRILNLRFNYIGDDGVEYLANALTTNMTLITLNLWHNQITGAGARSLADALQKNTTLTTLDLGHNQIGTSGTKYLADMLRMNSTLQILSLWDNHIKKKGAKYLAAALNMNRTLTTLDIGFNLIDDNGEQCLVDVLQTNKTLTTLNFENNPVIIT